MRVGDFTKRCCLLFLAIFSIGNPVRAQIVGFSNETEKKEFGAEVDKGPIDVYAGQPSVAWVNKVNKLSTGDEIGFLRGVLSFENSGNCAVNPFFKFAVKDAFQSINKGRPQFSSMAHGTSTVIMGTMMSASAVKQLWDVDFDQNVTRIFVYLDSLNFDSRKSSKFSLSQFAQLENFYGVKFKNGKLILVPNPRNVSSIYVCPATENSVPDYVTTAVNNDFSKPYALISLARNSSIFNKLINLILFKSQTDVDNLRIISEGGENIESNLKNFKAEILALRELDKLDRFGNYTNRQIATPFGENVKAWQSKYTIKSRSWDRCFPDESNFLEVRQYRCSEGVKLNVARPVDRGSEFFPLNFSPRIIDPKSEYTNDVDSVTVSSEPTKAKIFKDNLDSGRLTISPVNLPDRDFYGVHLQKSNYKECKYAPGSPNWKDQKRWTKTTNGTNVTYHCKMAKN